jgi:hypothetical protein
MLSGRDDAAKRKGPDTLDRELQQARRRAFCEGVREGERRTRELITNLTTTNQHLLKLVNLIDLKYPVSGITVSFGFAEQLIRTLRGRNPIACAKLADQVESIVDGCNCELGSDLAAMERELVELVG